MSHPDPAADRGTDASRAIDRFKAVRRQSLALAAPLSPEDCQVQSMPDASPVKWHLAHTTWFFETFLIGRFDSLYRSAHPAYRMLFNSYYNAVGERHPRPQRGLLTRPSFAEVLDYRAQVDDAMLSLIGAGADREFLGLLALGLNHEQQHQELMMTDVKHLLSCNPLGPAYLDPRHRLSLRSGPAAAGSGGGESGSPAGWCRYEGGIVTIGAGDGGFSFDNEGPRHPVLLQPFSLADRLVTCDDYLRFIAGGGYSRPDLWLSLGWDRAQGEGWEAPFYWRRGEAGWTHFTLSGWQPLEPRSPVAHLSYFEADAFARWAGARLPTEAEWEHAAGQPPSAGRPLMQVGTELWEWTGSPYQPYPGFRATADAVGEYNAKFMCNQYVLRGGSFATPAGHLRQSYRNFFPPEARWQFSGLRLARDEKATGAGGPPG